MVDVTPLRRVPGYRWLFSGMFFAQAGRQMTVVAVPVQIFQLTGSTLAVGMLGLAQLFPVLLVSVVGGALADALNRRMLIIISQLVLAATAAGLLWNSLRRSRWSGRSSSSSRSMPVSRRSTTPPVMRSSPAWSVETCFPPHSPSTKR